MSSACNEDGIEAMAEIHKLLEQHGKQAVLHLDVDRRVVEAAAAHNRADAIIAC